MHIQPIPCDLYGEICYLVSTDAGDAAVVDPGPGAERLLPLLEALDLTLRGILLTHGHLDHVGGVAAVAGSSCPVWIHPADLGIRAPIFGRLSGTRAYGEGDAPAVGGLRFRVLHTPGHTPGSVCLLCDEPASPDVPPVLFTGDTLFAGSCGRVDLDGSVPADMMRSLNRLAAMPGDCRVLPGHGPETTMAKERRDNYYMRLAAEGIEP